jgi:hypothetical protein
MSLIVEFAKLLFQSIFFEDLSFSTFFICAHHGLYISLDPQPFAAPMDAFQGEQRLHLKGCCYFLCGQNLHIVHTL